MTGKSLPKYLYVVFSQTPYKVGKMIRYVTKYEYNHASISFDKSLESLYSYARYYEDTPLYGGFVKESLRRYQCKAVDSKLRVYEIPLTEKQAKAALMLIDKYTKEQDVHVYNFLSVFTAPFGKSVPITGSYTCIGFVCHFLTCLGLYRSKEGSPTFKCMSRNLRKYLIYEGYSQEYHIAKTWGHDSFPIKRAKHRGLIDTAKNINCMLRQYRYDRYGSKKGT